MSALIIFENGCTENTAKKQCDLIGNFKHSCVKCGSSTSVGGKALQVTRVT